MSLSGKGPEVRMVTGWIQAEDAKQRDGRKHGHAILSTPQSEVELRNRLNELHVTSKLLSTESDLILSVVRTHFLFSRLTAAQLGQIVSSIEKISFTDGEAVVTQGDADAEHFYIINDGDYIVEVQKLGEDEPTKVARLRSGATLGEMALLHSTVRTATVRCVEDGTVFRLSRAAYLA